MIGLTSQWTILERLEYESIQAELARLDAPVQAGDGAAWEMAQPLLARVRQLVNVGHERASRAVPEGAVEGV